VSGRTGNLPRPAAFAGFGRAVARQTRWSTLRAVVDGLVVTVVLRRRGLRPLLITPASTEPRLDVARAMAVSHAVDAGLAVLPLRATCLRRSMTLLRELDRLGLAGTLHIGVRTAGHNVEAHAWVQTADRVINDDPTTTGTYTELVSGEIDAFLPMLR
jgi:hypothetical protein